MKIFLMITCLLTGQLGTALCQQLPMHSTRTIQIRTKEGTKMDVDLSPDGKMIAFQLLGNLFVMPATGGKARQITNDMSLNICPVWSPSSKELAYLSDFSGETHLNITDLSGRYHRVLGTSDQQVDLGSNTPHHCWSPDGKCLVLGRKIFCLNDSTVDLPRKVTNAFQFSNDGKSLYYFSSGTAPGVYEYQLSNGVTRLISHLTPSAIDYAISRDQNYLAYIQDDKNKLSLHVKNLTDQSDRLLVSTLLEDTVRHALNQGDNIPHFCFSPDSRGIFIAYGGKIRRINVGNGRNSVVPFVANVKVQLGPLNNNAYKVKWKGHLARYTRSAVANPAGNQIVFSALEKLYVIDLPKGKPRLLVNQRIAQFQPVWSPDGKWIAYASWCDTVGGQVWRVPSSGGTPELLTPAAGKFQRPVWSPDGKMIAVLKGTNQLIEPNPNSPDGQLQLIDLQNKQILTIADTVPLEGQSLGFSGDGKRIIYRPVQTRGKLKPQLVSKLIEGGGIQTVAVAYVSQHNTYRPLQPSVENISLSPDNRFLIYQRSEELYLIENHQSAMPSVVYDEIKKPLAIRFADGLDPHWEKGGKILSWSYANRFFRIDPEKIIVAALRPSSKEIDTAFEGNIVTTVHVIPDEVYSMNISLSPSYAKGTIALKGARIITMHGDEIIERGIVVIKNGRFMAIGRSGVVRIPSKATIIDLSGKTIIPGFVDVHSHLREPINIWPQQQWTFLINLAYGVTTARDPSSSYDSFGYSEMLESGQMIGPRLYSSGVALDARHSVTMSIMLNKLDEARSIVHQRKAMGGILIKQYEAPTRIQREWVALASKGARMNMTNEGAYNLILALGQLKDGSSGIEHNPEWADAHRDVIDLFAKSGTYFTPTLQVRPGARDYFNYTYWRQTDAKLNNFTPEDDLKRIVRTYEENKPGFALSTTPANFLYSAKIDAAIIRAGGKVCIGAHGNDQGIGFHNELWALQMGGIANGEVLRAATLTGAEAIGLQKDLGSIEVGKIADLVILKANPLDDIHHTRDIQYVMKGGILYDGDHLNELWPAKKTCPEWKRKN